MDRKATITIAMLAGCILLYGKSYHNSTTVTLGYHKLYKPNEWAGGCNVYRADTR